jgi:hypothetical protein
MRFGMKVININMKQEIYGLLNVFIWKSLNILFQQWKTTIPENYNNFDIKEMKNWMTMAEWRDKQIDLILADD